MTDKFANKYQLKQKLGRGGFATVYRAVDTTLDRDVAIKILDAVLQEEDETFISRFQREAKTVARLNHPHIIQIHEVGEYDDQHFIVMPYLPGPNLAQLLKQEGPMPPPKVVQFAEQIGSALDQAHRQGLIHRDLKPANIILNQDGQAILTDFGIVKIVGESTALTNTGAPIGTPQYMAPEQWKAGQLDARTDLYAFGIVLYQMLTGQVPFQGQTPHQIMYCHLEEEPPPLEHLNPHLPANIGHLFRKALAKEPAQRYESAPQMVSDLKRLLSTPAGSTTEADNRTMVGTRPPAPPPSTSRASSWLLVGGIALLILLGLGGLIGGALWSLTPASATPTQAVVEVAATPTLLPETATHIPTSALPTVTPTPLAEIVRPTEPPETATPLAIETAEVATSAVSAAADYAPPVLTEPQNDQSIPFGNPVTLRWQASPLGEDEQFALSLRHQEQGTSLPAQGFWTTTDPFYTVPAPLDAGTYSWLVMIEKEVDTGYETVSRSTSQQFVVLSPPATATPTMSPTSPAVPTSPSTPTPAASATAASPTGEGLAAIQLLEPTGERVFPNGTTRIEFRWRMGQDCNLPENLGFELRVWRPDNAPAGALDAVNQQAEISCDKGLRSFVVGDFQSAPGVAGAAAGEFLWDVLVVQIRPTYNAQAIDQSTTPIRFQLGSLGGGGGGDGGGGGGGIR